MEALLREYRLFQASLLSEKSGIFWVYKDAEASEALCLWGAGKLKRAQEGDFPCFIIASWEGDVLYSYTFPTVKVKRLKLSDIFSFKRKQYHKGKLLLSQKELYKKQQHYLSIVKAAKDLAQKGYLWVINLAERFPMLFSFEQALSHFEVFLAEKPFLCGGVVSLPHLKFCSFSPEVFLCQDDRTLHTFPIKGTGSKEYLLSQEKEASELAMIVDLLRNDLGMIARRVWVEKARYLTFEGNFYHARAHIAATLLEDFSLAHLQKLLPAGSISGAPKREVVKWICRLESFPRKFFTGTFGVRLSPKESIFNLLIRTLFWEGSNAFFPVGAGITAESDPEKEWEELLAKMEFLLSSAGNE